MNDVLRRNRVDQYTPAEKAIADALQAVEAAGAHPRLTDASNLLQDAQDAVADFVDGTVTPVRHHACRNNGAGRERGEEGAGGELSFSTQEGRIRVTFPPGMDEGKLSLAMLEAADFLVAPGVESGDELGSASAEPQRAFGQIRERMAEACHTQWSGWMKYLFSKCEILPNADKGDISVIPEWAVQRWKRQMDTAYPNLSEQEKDSDRKEADWLLALLGEAPPKAEQSHNERKSS